MSVWGEADMSTSDMSRSPGNWRVWMEIGQPEFWSRRMELSKESAWFGVAMMVAFTPWEANVLAMSIMGIWWPPPTKGKKKISTGAGFNSMRLY